MEWQWSEVKEQDALGCGGGWGCCSRVSSGRCRGRGRARSRRGSQDRPGRPVGRSAGRRRRPEAVPTRVRAASRRWGRDWNRNRTRAGSTGRRAAPCGSRSIPATSRAAPLPSRKPNASRAIRVAVRGPATTAGRPRPARRPSAAASAASTRTSCLRQRRGSCTIPGTCCGIPPHHLFSDTIEPILVNSSLPMIEYAN